MFSLTSQAFLHPVICSSRGNQDPHMRNLNIHINGNSTVSTTRVDGLNSTTTGGLTAILPSSSVQYVNKPGNVVSDELNRQNIPTTKQLVDPFRQGLITEGGVGYRQTVVIRSYEVGADKTATLESILNLLQETALNHVWMSGLLSDGFGATHGMTKNNLIWVVTRMQVQVDNYPIWYVLEEKLLMGEVLDIDTWVGASGKNGMRRDWVIRSHNDERIFARATSTWVMMNQKTRRLSKMPEVVRAEISPWFIDKYAIQEYVPEKIIKLDDTAKFVNSELKPKRSDLDMNHHVNNVKYVKWMLETIPDQFLEDHQLSSLILEYRRECGSSDVVQSLCAPDCDKNFEDGMQKDNDINIFSGFPFSSEILEGHGLLGSFNKGPLRYTHLLKVSGEQKNEEIVRGKTTWRRKLPTMPFST